MSFRNADSWLRELARSGLSPTAQKNFLATLSSTIDNRSRYFPADPVIFVERVRAFILHAFLPQKGPLLLSVDPDYPPEKISRSQCWNLVFLELSLLDGSNCPVDKLHTAIADIVITLVRCELPLSIPSRWLMDLFGVLERLALLKIEVHGWTVRPPGQLGNDVNAFVEAVLQNWENGRRRSKRQSAHPLVKNSSSSSRKL